MPTLTPNYSFNLPLVNNATDADLWGGYLNANWSSLDTILDGLAYVPAIGDVEFTTGNTNPSTKYPGTTWTQIAEGRFIVGVGQGTDANSDTRTYPAGDDSFGEYEHTLTGSETPLKSHNHNSGYGIGATSADIYVYGETTQDVSGSTTSVMSIVGGSAAEQAITSTASSSSATAHENSPPAFGLYVWERTA